VRRAGLTLLLGAALALPAPAGAVVGGKPVPPGQMGFVANVDLGGSFGCTGTLIAPDWVMTAGHCGSITGALTLGLAPSQAAWPAAVYDVHLGSVYADGSGGEDHAVTKVVVDSDYFATNGPGNDVSLLQLDKPSAITPIKIAAAGERGLWKPGVLSTVAGFGTTSEDASDPPDQMQVAQVPIVDDATCAADYPNGLDTAADDGYFDPKTMLCAGYPQGGTDTCEGDSGGPLLVPAADGSVRLAGATSFGKGCAEAGKPGVYARVAEGPIRAFVASVVPSAFAPEPQPAAAKTAAPAKHHAQKKKKNRKRHHRHHRHRRSS
jgi:secreted trypsin-like serine protease